MRFASAVGAWVGRILVVSCLLMVRSGLAADLSPEVLRGVQWLNTQVQADGSLANEAASIAASFQVRSEAAQTLALLSSAPSNLIDSVLVGEGESTEQASRRAVVLALLGRDPAAAIAVLVLRQNADGGFGGAPGRSSNVLDTAWATLALTYGGQATSATANAARSYIASALQADGQPKGLESTEAGFEAGAIGLMALQTTIDSSVATAALKLSGWLRQQQAADGSWNNDPYLTAIALVALAPTLTDTTALGMANAFLLARQAADGSWNSDSFLTAVALRALTARAGISNALPATITGQIIDQGGNLPLDGVSVAISGATTASAVTDATGRFTAGNLPAGSYTVQISRPGYGARSLSITLNPGQSFDVGVIGISQVTTAGIVRGQVVAAASSTPLAGVIVSVTGSVGLNTVTDANGRFEFANVTPGAINLTASLAGYQAAAATATILAGQTLLFSPALYRDSDSKPTTGRFVGAVVAAATGAPLAGVSIQLNGAQAAVTGADGRFDLTLAAAAYAVTYSLSGYNQAAQNFVLAAGSTANAGVVALTVQRTTTTLQGKVADSAGKAVVGAAVQVIGGVSTTTGSDGTYQLANLTGTSFDLRVSAAGYSSQQVTFQVSQPTDVTKDFTLLLQSSKGLTLGDLIVQPASAASRTEVTVSTTVGNGGAEVAEGILSLQVRDASDKVVATGAAYGASNDPLGQFTLAPGQSLAAKLVWNTAQFAPGSYALLVRIVEPGSVSRENPAGTVIVERQGTVTVTGQSHFIGSITANPPVLRAGLNLPVQLSAVVQGDGNQEVPAQSYTLKAINTKTNAVAMTQSVAAESVPVSGLQTLPFADWVPVSGGNYRLELAAADPAQGLIIGEVYVGDSAKAAFTVDKIVVPVGTQTVHATINVTGQDVENGTISDPLAPLVKAAIQKAVTFNDSAARQWTISNRCQGCHIQTQALVGGETNRRLSTFNALQRATIFNNTSINQRADGTLIDGYGGYPRTLTMLGLWALNAYHDKPAIAATIRKAADWTVSTQESSTGRWYADYGTGWWAADATNTAFNLKSLVDARELLSTVPGGNVLNYSTKPFAQNLNQTSRSFISQDSAGNLYFSVLNAGKVVQIKPDGSIGTTWSGLNDPRAVIEAFNAIVVSTSNGLYQLNVGGSSSQLNPNGNFEHLVLSPDGRLFASGWNTNSIYVIDGNWAATTWVSGGLLNRPSRLSFTPSGELLVANYGGGNILRYRSDKSYAVVVEMTNGNPTHVVSQGSDWLVGSTSGLYRYNSDWEGERRLYERIDGILPLADGLLIGAAWGVANLKEIVSTAADVPTSLTNYANSIGKAATWLTNFTAASNDNLVQAHQLIGLGSAFRYFKGRDTARASTIKAKMDQIAATLRARPNANGGWGRYTGSASDSMVTAQVGTALDYLDPSPSDPVVRNAVQFLLNRQQADGSWISENGILSTKEAATTWVSIWLPIILNRLGGIDTDLTITLPANVTLSSPDQAPTSSQATADGGMSYKWKLVGVTAEGRSLGFDATLANLLVNEERPVAQDAHLTFNNAFTNQPVDAAIAVPRVVASAFLDLGVVTDKPQYSAGVPVAITAQVTNTALGLNAGTVKFEIFAPDNVLVADIGTQAFNGLTAGANVQLPAGWDTGTTLAGPGYYVLASLYDGAGGLVAASKAPFAIVAVAGSGTLAAAKVTTDKVSYQPSETVRLADRLNNLTANQPLADLMIVTTVANPDGSIRWSRSESLAELPAGTAKDYAYALPLAYAPAGAYAVSLELRNVTGTLLATASTSFTVQSSTASGSGLKGTLAAVPQEVPQGDLALLSFTVGNAGNAAFGGLPLKVSLVDPLAQRVLAEFPATIDLAVGGIYVTSLPWSPPGAVGSTYVAVLSATVGGSALTLAQTTLKVVAPPIKLDLGQGFASGTRLLVLAGCGQVLGAQNTAGLAGCVTARAQRIDALLGGLSIPHFITTDPVIFRKELRSGRYNGLWLSARLPKLPDDLAEEVREAAFRGTGLLIDGDHDERNAALDDAAGIRYLGKLGAQDATLSLAGRLFAVGNLASQGHALKVELAGGSLEASLPGNGNAGPLPGIVSRDYGQGHTLFLGLDLIESLNADGGWRALLESGFAFLTPAAGSGAVGVGESVPVRLTVANLAQATDIEVRTTLPVGAALLASEPPALVVDGVANWLFPLAAGASQAVDFTLGAPTQPGAYSLSTTVSTVRAGTATPYGAPLVQTLTVSGAAQVLGEATVQLQGLTALSKDDARARDQALAQAQSAQSALAAGQYEAAIHALVQAVDAVRQILGAETRAIRLAFDRGLQEAGWRSLQP